MIFFLGGRNRILRRYVEGVACEKCKGTLVFLYHGSDVVVAVLLNFEKRSSSP